MIQCNLIFGLKLILKSTPRADLKQNKKQLNRHNKKINYTKPFSLKFTSTIVHKIFNYLFLLILNKIRLLCLCMNI